MMSGTKDIYEFTVSEVQELEGSLHYFITESESEDYSCKTYGIRVEKRINNVLVDSEELLDITTMYKEILDFTSLISRNTVTPVCISEVVEDYLNAV